jgi:cobalt ECF transporter T component CbiQ
MLPSWVTEVVSARTGARRRHSHFIERTLGHTSRFIGDAVFAERVARRPGYLQQLDARAKLFSLLGLLVAAAFCHHLPPLWLIGGFIVVSAARSRIEVTALFNRVWWFLPGIFLIIAVPAAFNLITPGDPLLIIYRAHPAPRFGPVPLPAELSITRQGIASAALLITRILLGVLLAVTITLTSRWQALLKAVYTNATAPFVLVLAMTYRYIFVLLWIVENMHLARRARTIAPAGPAAERRWIGGRIAALFSRSRLLTEHVYAAMLARGYRGHPRALTTSRFTWREAAWLIACAAVAALALVLDRVVLRGLRW